MLKVKITTQRILPRFPTVHIANDERKVSLDATSSVI